MTASVALAARNEERVLRAAHPVAFPFVSAIPGPVRRVPGLGVVVKDADLLRAVVRSTSFSKIGPGASSDLWNPILGPHALLNMDGEEHLVLRRRLAPLFAPGFVDGLVVDGLGAATEELSAALGRGEPVDLVAHARRSASAVVARLLGIDPGALGDELYARVSRITGFVTLTRPRLTPGQLAEARSVVADIGEHAKLAYRGDDSTVPGRMRALGLDESEALGAVGAFALTGTETIVSYLPRLTAILIDSGWLARLSQDRSHVDQAIAEGLRVTTPSLMMIRSTVAADAIGPVAVRPGDRILLGTYWADRALGEFDPETNPAAQLKQLWFGAGAHYCIGAPLAMAQIRLMLSALLEHPRLAIVDRQAARGVLIPSYSRLVLREAG